MELNWLVSSVCSEPQRGQATAAATGSTKPVRGPRPIALTGMACCVGGAMPYSRNLRLASSPNQSVVHGGEIWMRRRVRVTPWRCSASRMDCEITSVAGQPL